jgi:hypothetical protein
MRAIDSIDCAVCLGHGWRPTDGGPGDQSCKACYGSGAARCRDCSDVATTLDCDADGEGPTCESCAIRCEYCRVIATEVRVTEARVECVCAECGDVLRRVDERVARIAAWEDHGDAVRKERREEGGAA